MKEGDLEIFDMLQNYSKMKAPEQHRIKKGAMGSDSSYGNNGAFEVPHYKIANYSINCIASDGMGWQHVSVTLTSTERKVDRCPTWEEMCFIKSLFWNDDESVMQLHPPKSEWVNNHPYCLHLWKPDGIEIPLPLGIMVGHKKLNTKKNITQ